MDRNARTFATLFMVSDVSQRLRSALEFGAVIAIIMALISFAARNFETYIIQSQISEAFMLTSTVRGEMVTFRAETGRWPSNEAELHNPTLSQESGLGRVVDHLELRDGGAISVVFDDESSAANLQGRRLTLRPLLVTSEPSGPISWVCASHRIPDGLAVGGIDETDIDAAQLPSACRKY